MTLTNQLQKLGFTPNESLTYLALFEIGTAKAGQIIRETGLHRNLVYVALQELVERKLVSVSKLRGIAVYTALSANRLLTDVQEKERLAKEVIEELSIVGKKSSVQEIVVYQGIEEFKRHVLNTFNTVKPNSLIRYLGTSSKWYEIVGNILQEKLLEIQRKKKITMKALANSITTPDKKFLKSAPWAQIKTSHLISNETSGIEILDNRISIRSFIEPYFVVEITHKQLAKNYQAHFDFLWKLKL